MSAPVIEVVEHGDAHGPGLEVIGEVVVTITISYPPGTRQKSLVDALLGAHFKAWLATDTAWVSPASDGAT